MGMHRLRKHILMDFFFPVTFRTLDSLPTVQEKREHKAKNIRKTNTTLERCLKRTGVRFRKSSPPQWELCVQPGCG